MNVEQVERMNEIRLENAILWANNLECEELTIEDVVYLGEILKIKIHSCFHHFRYSNNPDHACCSGAFKTIFKTLTKIKNTILENYPKYKEDNKINDLSGNTEIKVTENNILDERKEKVDNLPSNMNTRQYIDFIKKEFKVKDISLFKKENKELLNYIRMHMIKFGDNITWIKMAKGLGFTTSTREEIIKQLESVENMKDEEIEKYLLNKLDNNMYSYCYDIEKVNDEIEKYNDAIKQINMCKDLDNMTEILENYIKENKNKLVEKIKYIQHENTMYNLAPIFSKNINGDDIKKSYFECKAGSYQELLNNFKNNGMSYTDYFLDGASYNKKSMVIDNSATYVINELMIFSNSDYDLLINNLMNNIKVFENKGGSDILEDGSYLNHKCILCMNEDKTQAILIDPQFKNYANFSGLIDLSITLQYLNTMEVENMERNINKLVNDIKESIKVNDHIIKYEDGHIKIVHNNGYSTNFNLFNYNLPTKLTAAQKSMIEKGIDQYLYSFNYDNLKTLKNEIESTYNISVERPNYKTLDINYKNDKVKIVYLHDVENKEIYSLYYIPEVGEVVQYKEKAKDCILSILSHILEVHTLEKDNKINISSPENDNLNMDLQLLASKELCKQDVKNNCKEVLKETEDYILFERNNMYILRYFDECRTHEKYNRNKKNNTK